MADESQILVRFTTKLSEEFRVPPAEVVVPASLRRYGLSQIVNHLLATDPPLPFDFVIDGELVRRSLEQHLLQHNISPEAVVEVEYVPAVVPPEAKAALPHEDWITAVAAVSNGSCLASGAADGVVRLWSGGGECPLKYSAHKMGVTALAAVSTPQQQQQQQPSLLLSAGKDHALRLWQLTVGPHQQQQHNGAVNGVTRPSAQCVAVYLGHEESVQSVAASPGGDYCCSGGWDGQLLLWRTGQQLVDQASTSGLYETAEPAAGKNKRRKVGSAANGTTAAAAPLELRPTAALEGHVHCVAAVAWPEPGALYSGGWDHSVRRYDVETRANIDTYNGSKAIYAIAAPTTAGANAPSSSSGSSDVVAFGGSDRVLRIWDTRSVKGEGLAVKAYAAHESWIASIAWRPNSSYHVATGSHDGCVKVWDIRTAVPVGSLQHHKDKVLCVGWWASHMLASGGADCKLQLYDLP